jgi:hypothetical protein
MSDYNSGLPIRTEADGTDERLHAKIVDGADPSKRMTVDADLNAHVEMHGNTAAGADKVVRLSESGNVILDGEYDISLNSIPSTVGLMGHVRNAAPGLTHLLQRLTSVTSGIKRLLDVSIHDEDGVAFSASNPLPVTSVDSEGTEVNHFSQATVAAGLTSTHYYTVTALKTLKLSQIWASASGKLKIEVQKETGIGTGLYESIFVGFNSTAAPNICVSVNENIAIAAGVKVQVIRSNLDKQSQDVYSTISGHEI